MSGGGAGAAAAAPKPETESPPIRWSPRWPSPGRRYPAAADPPRSYGQGQHLGVAGAVAVGVGQGEGVAPPLAEAGRFLGAAADGHRRADGEPGGVAGP